jgi:hypothetical protein
MRSTFLFGDGVSDRFDCSNTEPSSGRPQDATKTCAVTAADDRARSEESAVVLPFPIHGEALLVRLADLLRNRFFNLGPAHDPFLFALSRRPGSRLTIDCKSFVEFVPSRSEFRFEIVVPPNTNINLTTPDFDALVEFVVQYVAARLAETRSLEVAS